MIYLKGEGIPEIYCYGNNRYYNILVLELLGKSLEDWFTQSKNKFSVATVCKLGIEMIKRVQLIHEKNHIHRDIKPENLLLDEFKNLKIVDFGLSNTYKPGEKL